MTSWVDFEDFERAREWINEPQPHQVEDGSFYDDEGPEPYGPEETDHGHGTSAIGRCEQCGRALDWCDCYGPIEDDL